MLFRRFHEDVLKCFGFKKLQNDGNPTPNFGGTGNRASHGGLNESAISSKPPHPSHSQAGNNNGSFINDARDRSGDRMPPVGHPSTMSQELRPSQLPGKPLDRKTNLSQNNINKHPPPPPAHNYPSSSSHIMPQSMVQPLSNPYGIQNLDLASYPAPHPASPLSKHLNKLLPPNESIINFFNTLFQESS
jgi:hypothetical protein